MEIPIEDGFEDVLMKAAVGLRLGHAALASQAGLSTTDVRSLVDGVFNEAHLRGLAPVLGLDAGKLVSLAKKEWRPQPVDVSGLELFHMPFPEASYPDATVNAYLVFNQETKDAIVFDAGTSAAPILEFLESRELRLKALFLTHTHRDHVGGYDALAGAVETDHVYAPAKEPFSNANLLEPGMQMSLCGFGIQAIETSGHSVGGMSYLIGGLERPVAIVGDALFSLSMGGAKHDYQRALENNRSKLLSLPGDTVLCPGHGPLTTVAEELAHNPFF